MTMARQISKRIMMDPHDRQSVGIHLLDWHSSGGDPIYAVGSFYLDGEVYPDVEVVREALSNINYHLSQQKQMLAGKKVKSNVTSDLRKFAGYKKRDLEENIAELAGIATGLEYYLKKDYNTAARDPRLPPMSHRLTEKK